jgi:RNA polymerase sigma-70 factor (sigma-E family)
MYGEHPEARATRRPGAHPDGPAAAGRRPGHWAVVIMRVAARRGTSRGSGSQEPLPPAAGRPIAGGADQQADDLVSDLYQAHALSLVRMAKLLLRDQPSAEDVVQDAFLGLYRAWPGLRDRDHVLPYLRAAVINGSRSVLRSRRRALLRPVHHEPPASSAESAAMVGEDRREVLAAVARLPRRMREVLVLRYYLGLPDQEIAAALGVSRGTVSSTASRGLAAVARDLGEES